MVGNVDRGAVRSLEEECCGHLRMPTREAINVPPSVPLTPPPSPPATNSKGEEAVL